MNWPIFEGGRLVQPVAFDKEHFERAPHPAQDDVTAAHLDEIKVDPAAGDLLDRTRPITPEYCAILRPTPNQDGWTQFLQVRPDGRAASVSFATEHSPYAIRWISNTGNESAAGFCLPSSAHHLGRAAAERDGMVRSIPGGASVEMKLAIDFLDKVKAAERIQRVEAFTSGA